MLATSGVVQDFAGRLSVEWSLTACFTEANVGKVVLEVSVHLAVEVLHDCQVFIFALNIED